MLENEGTTPEQGFTIKSIEDAEPTKPSYETLEARIEILEAKLVLETESNERWYNAFTNAKQFIQNSINSDDWSESELQEPFWTELAELMDLEINRTIEVEITVTFTGTMTMPAGTDPEDIPDYDWSTELEHSYYGSDFDVYEINVRER